MAIIKPFNGVRYNEKDITKLICPPYDVISPEQKEQLKKKSPYNMVKLELPDGEGARNKYQQSNVLFNQWLEKGALCKDEKPAFYFYEQSFKDHGVKKVRRGFFAALRLENPHGGAVKPHERTLAKPKEDRLKLIRSVRANLSPIFGLFNDKNKKVVNFCAKLAKTAYTSIAKDEEGTTHKVWRIDNPKEIAWIEKALASQKIFIADGHHRYETAWNYSQEMKKKDKKYSPEKEYNYVMIFLCPMEDKGLSIWPTHRVLEIPEGIDERINEYFDVLPASEFKKLETKSPQPLVVYINGKGWTLVVKNRKFLAKAMPDKCKAYQDLGVSILHSLLLSNVAPETVTYVKDEKEAIALAKKRKGMAVIVPATPIEAVKAIALADQTMPQKSTYFFPKVGSGIVIHTVK